jgi:hypothetical protein
MKPGCATLSAEAQWSPRSPHTAKRPLCCQQNRSIYRPATLLGARPGALRVLLARCSCLARPGAHRVK